MIRTIALLLLVSPILHAADVTATVNPDCITFKSGSDLITDYKYAGTVAVEKGEGTKPLAKPYFYPLLAPGGIKVTRDWPMSRGEKGETVDHFHQKSAWFCHGDVLPDGVELKTKAKDKAVKGVDFWAEFPGHGRIVCKKVNDPEHNDGTATVTTFNEWLTPDGIAILSEKRVISVNALKSGYLISVASELTPVMGAVTFGDTKEGSFGVRVPDSFRLNGPGSTGIVTAADGSTAKAPAKDNLTMWGQHSAWNDYSGTVKDKAAGISILAHPKNAYASAWHTRAYGLMAANPFGRKVAAFPATKDQTELVKLKKGETLKLSYAIYAHSGDAKAAKVSEVYEQYAK
ncbi:hypothetical protein BH11PLA2_BH11PLA2_17140 [soil metagenome]